MKITFILVIFALVLATMPVIAEAEEAMPVSSIELTRLMGNGTNLGNTLEACNNGAQYGNTTDDPLYYETMWGQPVTTALERIVRKALEDEVSEKKDEPDLEP